jgi:hypothetical protein
LSEVCILSSSQTLKAGQRGSGIIRRPGTPVLHGMIEQLARKHVKLLFISHANIRDLEDFSGINSITHSFATIYLQKIKNLPNMALDNLCNLQPFLSESAPRFILF